MTNLVADRVMNAALADVSGNATALHVCSGSPTSRATVLTNSLGNVTIDSGDFTQADGDTSGRKNTIAQQAIASASASGTAHTVALIDGTTDFYVIADLASDQAITSGNPITVNAFDHEIRDPA